MNEQSFTVKTDVFEGPLDLLLSLIEKRKLFINDISLAQVADDYINHVKALGSLPMDATAHFILVASTLLLIKSKSLLPSMPLTEEEVGSIEDLEHRLHEYKKYKELSKHVAHLLKGNSSYFKLPSKQLPVVFTPDETITTASLLTHIKQALQSVPLKEILPKVVVQKIISLEEMIDRLSDRITSNLKLSFSEFAKTQAKDTSSQGSKHIVRREEKVAIIVSFLAMLELVKQGAIDVVQSGIHDDIEIETTSLSVPNYGEV